MQNLLVPRVLSKLLLLLWIANVKRLSNKVISVPSALSWGLQRHWLHSASLSSLLLCLLLLIASRGWCALSNDLLEAAIVALSSWIVLTLIVWMYFHDICLTSILSFKLLLGMVLLVYLLLVLGFLRNCLSNGFFRKPTVSILTTLPSRLNIELPLLLNFWVLNESLRAALWGTGRSVIVCSHGLEIQSLWNFVWGEIVGCRCVATLASVVGSAILGPRGSVALSCISFMVASWRDELLRGCALSGANYKRWVHKICMNLIVLAPLWRPCGVGVLYLLFHFPFRL